MLLTANRHELDISLLAEPSSDEDEEPTIKRTKCRRRKLATMRGVDSKAEIRLLPTAAVTSSDQAAVADSTSQSAFTAGTFIPPAKTRKRMKSLCPFFHSMDFCSYRIPRYIWQQSFCPWSQRPSRFRVISQGELWNCVYSGLDTCCYTQPFTALLEYVRDHPGEQVPER